MGQDDIAPSGFGTLVGASGSTDYAIPAATFSGYPEPLWFPENGDGISLLMFLQCPVSKKAVV
jgi:hypothetical protein